MMQRGSNRLCKQAKYNWKRELFEYLCEKSKGCNEVIFKRCLGSQRSAYDRWCANEIPMQVDSLLLLLVLLAPLSFWPYIPCMFHRSAIFLSER